ncbi:MAG: SAM-dependent methyltransferase [Lachnospiraceae bacterium]|nr:SAM-dependent methyltransferase [Lachnospiraceae bacterium]
MFKLSKRLEALGRLCEAGTVAADVGCDHGYLSIRLIREGIFSRMLAMDLREGPLAAAREHVAEAGLSDRIECRLSDGLRAMQTGEAEAVICAGMGGPLMQRILEQDIDKVRQMKQLVLQPQSDIGAFRRWLRENGFFAADEEIVFEDGKYYPMMRVVTEAADGMDSKRKVVSAGRDIDPALADAFGPILLARRHPVLLEYLKQRNGFVSEALEQLDMAQRAGCDERRAQRMTELQHERKLIQKAISIF